MDEKPLDATTTMWTRQAIMAYLHGEHTLSWIVGMIEAVGDTKATLQFLDELNGYGDPERRYDLRRRLEEEAA